MLESHWFWRGAFETVRHPRRQEYESVRLELNRERALNCQCANTGQAVMQTRCFAGIEAQSPAMTYVADREMGYADIEDGQQMIQDDMRG